MVHTTALLDHVAAPLIRFVPRKQTPFPKEWEQQEYRAWMFLFGVIPLGWQAIVISFPDMPGKAHVLRDQGYGPMMERWDHWIEVEPAEGGPGTRYTDRVTVEAGLLTPIVAFLGRVFFKHRQRRLRALAASGFAALRG